MAIITSDTTPFHGDKFPEAQETQHHESTQKLDRDALLTLAEINEDEDIRDLLKNGDIKTLAGRDNDPEAQLAAITCLSNNYRFFSLGNKEFIELMGLIDLSAIPTQLDLGKDELELIERKRSELLNVSDDLHSWKEIAKRSLENANNSWEYSTQQREQLFEHFNGKEKEIRRTLELTYRELMLPVRKRILQSELPDLYKRHVIEGIKGDVILKEENDLLRSYYPNANPEIKEQIIDTVMHNIGHDLDSFDVIPFNDLEVLGNNMDKLFIATMGNAAITEDFVRERVAPEFLPTYDPEIVAKCWNTLRKVTKVEFLGNGTSFFSDGYNHDTNSMNIGIFRNFLENSEKLIPIVDVLSEYGFTYLPKDIGETEERPQYIEQLLELGDNLSEIKRELDVIKRIIPDYKYRFAVTSRYPDTKSESEIYINDNPFVIALEQKINPHKINNSSEFDNASLIFESLLEEVPDRWKSGFLSKYVELMSKTASDERIPDNIGELAISKANKYALDQSIKPEDIESYATRFFRASILPRNGNVEGLFRFCKQHADKVATWGDDGLNVNPDLTWSTFSVLASDIYRYPLRPGDEEAAVEKTKQDMRYAIDAIANIGNPKTRDNTILNVVYGLTDEEVDGLETAISLVETMDDLTMKNEALEAISLEEIRKSLTESTSWKKMERIRRSSRQNTEFLKNLFGYGSREDLSVAQSRYRETTSTYSGISVDYSPDRSALLEKEINRISNNFQVTINMTWRNVRKTLESGRILSIWEKPEEMENRNNSMMYNYESRRDIIERKIGNKSKGGMKDPHPIYAAAATPNDRDEFWGGTGGGYGETFFVLKNERIQNRTSFCYDDSFDGFNDWVLDWEGGIVAKGIHNLNGKKSRHGYVEAQIFGGVSLDDIESINIPSDVIYGKNRFGVSLGPDMLSEIEQIRQHYPHITINIIEVPNNENIS